MLGQDTILLNTGSFSPRISVQVLLESLKVIQEGTKEVSILKPNTTNTLVLFGFQKSFRDRVYGHPWQYKGEGAAHVVFSSNPQVSDKGDIPPLVN